MTITPEFYDETLRRARKAHKCCECHGKIPVGLTYMLVNGKWDGEVSTFRLHQTCHEISKLQYTALAAVRDRNDDMPAFGEMVEEAREDADEGGCFPSYWPVGVWISIMGLQRHVTAVERLQDPRCPKCGSLHVPLECGRHGHTGDRVCVGCGYEANSGNFQP